MKFEPPNHGNVAGTPEQTDDGPCWDLQDGQSHVYGMNSVPYALKYTNLF